MFSFNMPKRASGIRILIAAILSLASWPAAATDPDVRPEKLDAVKKNTKTGGTAFTLTYPLGLHEEADIDTTLYNFQRHILPSLHSDAMAVTGNLGAEGIDMIYVNRDHGQSPFFFEKALSMWLPTIKSQKFYNVFTPMTLLGYDFGGNRDNHTDWLSGRFGGNVNRNIGVGAMVDYLYSKGCYQAQATKDFSYGGNVYYYGHRYEMQALFHAFNFLNKENGGITDDLYITDPALLQAGDTKVESKSIPTNLSDAHTRLTGSRFFTTQTLKLGFWEEEQVNDTLSREVYIPVTRITYALDYQTRRHVFKNTNATQAADFFTNTYLNPYQTYDNTHYWHLANSLGIELVEGFRNWAKFGLSAYVTYQIRRYRQTSPDGFGVLPPVEEEDMHLLTPLPSDIDFAPVTTQNLLSVGGRIAKTKGNLLRYTADVRLGLSGETAGEIDAKGDIATNFRLFGDTVSLRANARFSNLAPSWLLKQYVSNHFAWHNDFGKIRRFGVGGSLSIPWTRTTVSIDFENVQNHVYFNSVAMPRQHSATIPVFSARLQQNLHFGIWNWNNTITYQESGNQDVIPLPKLAVYSNMYLAFKAFRVLDLQIGVDCDYFTRYRGLMYQPATMSFHVQNAKDAILVGDYALCNAYITAKLYKVRFYVLWSHVNQGWFSKNYFSLPHYPVDPRRLQFGLCVDFAD